MSAGVSRGKGQDLFLRSFHESLQIIKEEKLKVPPVHAVVVGSDMSAHTKFETELRSFVTEKKIQNRVHFINKTLTVAPYLASIDVLVQNSQVFAAGSSILCQRRELLLNFALLLTEFALSLHFSVALKLRNLLLKRC